MGNTNVAPATLAPRIIGGVDASLSEDEGVDEGESEGKMRRGRG